jgi:hypothetical protein
MYAQSATRHASVAAILVATLAGIVAASVERGGPTTQLTARPAPAARYADTLPQLPEVVVTAPRLAS